MALVPKLAVDAEGLFFGSPGARRGARLRFAPESAALEGVEAVRRLPWEKVLDPVDIWADGYPVVFGDHWAISGPERFDGTSICVGDDRFRVRFSFSGVLGASEVAAASALCAYLRDVPAARQGLAHRDAISGVVEALEGHDWLSRSRTPLAGASLDVSRHLLRSLKVFGVHCYLGRLVEGETAPSAPDVTEAVRSSLPRYVVGKATTADAVSRRYERLRSATRWPFAVLVT